MTILDKKHLLLRHLGFLILLIWLFSPILIWDDVRFLIHDNLNSNVPWILNLLRSGKIFSSPSVILDHVFDGLPRFVFQSEFFFYVFCFKLFPPKLAYFAHYCFIHVIAYLGMYLLCKDYLIKKTSPYAIICITLVSLCFSLLPFWPTGSLSIAGMPFVTWAILNIGSQNTLRLSWSIIIGYNFFTYIFFFSTLWFVIFSLFLLSIIYLSYPNHRPHLRKMFFPLLVIMLIGVLIEYRLFYNQLFLKLPSHRTLWNKEVLNFRGVIGVSFKHFLSGHYHFHSVHQILLILLLIIVLHFRKRLSEIKHIVLIVGVLLLLSFLGVIQNWTFFKTIVSATPANGLNFRFFSLVPFAWYILLAVMVNKVIDESNRGLTVTLLILISLNAARLLFSVGIKDYYGNNYSENIFANSFFLKNAESEKWHVYFMTKEIEELKKVVPVSEKVLAIGVNNEILQYSGYKTCGAYQFFIPLKSIRAFHGIFECENKNIAGGGSSVKVAANALARHKCQINTKVLFNTFKCRFIVSDEPLKIEENWLLQKTGQFFVYKLKE